MLEPSTVESTTIDKQLLGTTKKSVTQSTAAPGGVDTPNHLDPNNKKLDEIVIKTRTRRPQTEIDQQYIITNSRIDKIDKDVITNDDNTINVTDTDDNSEGGIVTVSSYENNYMMISVIVLVTIIVILIITIIFILYKNYQFTHSKNLSNSDSDTFECSYPLYTSRSLESPNHVYSNSVQTTPYKLSSSNQNHSNTFHNYYQHQQQHNPSSHYSNYYATSDLIRWHNRKYLPANNSCPPADL